MFVFLRTHQSKRPPPLLQTNLFERENRVCATAVYLRLNCVIMLRLCHSVGHKVALPHLSCHITHELHPFQIEMKINNNNITKFKTSKQLDRNLLENQICCLEEDFKCPRLGRFSLRGSIP